MENKITLPDFKKQVEKDWDTLFNQVWGATDKELVKHWYKKFFDKSITEACELGKEEEKVRITEMIDKLLAEPFEGISTYQSIRNVKLEKLKEVLKDKE